MKKINTFLNNKIVITILCFALFAGWAWVVRLSYKCYRLEKATMFSQLTNEQITKRLKNAVRSTQLVRPIKSAKSKTALPIKKNDLNAVELTPEVNAVAITPKIVLPQPTEN